MTPGVRAGLAAVACALVSVGGCTVGDGWGLVEGCIHMPGCRLDPGGDPPATCGEDDRDFRFEPDFFGAEAYEDGSLDIVVRSSGTRTGPVDGFSISIPDRVWAAGRLAADPDAVLDSERVPVLPVDELEGVPVAERIKVSSYWYASCPDTVVAFNEGVGTIWFHSMYQSRDLGDPRDEAIVHLGFDLEFVDPWPEETPGPDSPRLLVTGEIRFRVERGAPAQSFP